MALAFGEFFSKACGTDSKKDSMRSRLSASGSARLVGVRSLRRFAWEDYQLRIAPGACRDTMVCRWAGN